MYGQPNITPRLPRESGLLLNSNSPHLLCGRVINVVSVCLPTDTDRISIYTNTTGKKSEYSSEKITLGMSTIHPR